MLPTSATRRYFRLEVKPSGSLKWFCSHGITTSLPTESIEIPSAAHGNTTVVKEADVPTDTFSHRNIKRATSQIVDDKDAIPATARITLITAATGSCIKATLPIPANSAALKSGVPLHLVKRGGDRDHRARAPRRHESLPEDMRTDIGESPRCIPRD